MSGSHTDTGRQKKVCVVRLGAYGDMIMVTPLLRALKEDGFHVTVNTNPRGQKMLENNPHVDAIIPHKDDSIPIEKLQEHWDEMAKGFDKFVNLSGSVEGSLLKVPDSPVYYQPHFVRHSLCDVNYYDNTMRLGGYGDKKGVNGELYFSKEEEAWARKKLVDYAGKFRILWSLSGSSVHKFYPWAETVSNEFCKKHPDAQVILVGEPLCKMLAWDHPQVSSQICRWNIRQSMVVAKNVDLVIGPETGVLNAAGCFETPKIVFLSHSSHENLSKNWLNCYPVEASKVNAPCHPCHKMIYGRAGCRLNRVTQTPLCMAHLEPQQVLEKMEEVYSRWKEK